MKNILEMLKGNPVVVISLLVMLGGIAAICYVIFVAEPAFLTSVSDRSQQKRAISELFDVAQVDGMKVPVTETHIDERKEANASFSQVYQQLFFKPVQDNQQRHEPFTAGIFPRETGTQYFTARTDYPRQFENMYDLLQAGMPPSKENIEENSDYNALAIKISQTRRTIERILNDPTMAATPSGQNQLAAAREDLAKDYEDLRAAVLRVQLQRAKSIAVYGERPDLTRGEGTDWSAGFFDIKPWFRQDDKPADYMEKLWNAQMDVWVQRDIVDSIRLANGLNENTAGENPSVLTAPVKKIESIVVATGYVPPASGEEAGNAITMAFSPSAETGRRSNRLFDVKRATVTMLVDAAQIPQIMNAFGSVNFQTPIIAQIKNVDDRAERTAEPGGFMFGSDVDVVRLVLTVESLWLRRWTAGHTSVESAQSEFEALFLDSDRELSPRAQTLVEQYRELDDNNEKLAFIRENYYNPGLMPDAIRTQRGLEPLDDSTAGGGGE